MNILVCAHYFLWMLDMKYSFIIIWAMSWQSSFSMLMQFLNSLSVSDY